MAHYLLVLRTSGGQSEHVTQHVIEAEDRQMVKYHYHRTLKDWGWADTQYGKHSLENWDTGSVVGIEDIRKLNSVEWNVLNRHLTNWTKV